MPSDRVRLNLSKTDLDELAAIASEADRLKEIISTASRVGPRIGTKAVAEEISTTVGLNEADLRFILVGLLNLYFTQTRLDLDSTATVEVVSHNLKRLAKSPDEKELIAAWDREKQKIASGMSQLSPDHPLVSAAKAIRVITSRQYDFVKMKVYTDVRPVFNDAGDKIVQSIIAHVLSIDYHDGQVHHVIQFTLDAKDVAELRKECERAELKGSVLKRDLKNLPWPTSVFREPATPTSNKE